MGRILISILWITHACLSEDIVHFVQKIVNTNKCKITGSIFSQTWTKLSINPAECGWLYNNNKQAELS